MHCRRLPRAVDAATALPAVAAPLPRCLRRSADAATALPPLTPRCRRRRRAARRRHAATAPGVAHDSGNKGIVPERAQEGHGWR
jgi:hypothetical protein